MSDEHKEHRLVCTFNGIQLFADCDEKKATALARVFARYAVRSDLKVDSILEEAGLKDAPPIKQEPEKASIPEEKNRPKFADRDADEKKRVAAAKALDDHEDKEDVAPRPGVEREVPRQDPGPAVMKLNPEPVKEAPKPIKDSPKQPK